LLIFIAALTSVFILLALAEYVASNPAIITKPVISEEQAASLKQVER